MNSKIFKVFLLIGDIFLMYLSLILALALRHHDFTLGSQLTPFLWHFSFIFLFWILLLYVFDFYNIFLFEEIFFKNLFFFLFLSMIVAMAYIYLKPGIVISPKTILLLNIVIFGILFSLWRFLFKKIRNKQKIIIAGTNQKVKELFPKLFSFYRVIAFFDDNLEKELAKKAKHGIISDISQLEKIIDQEKVNLIVFQEKEEIIDQIFSNLSLKTNYIKFVDFYENIMKRVPLEIVKNDWFLENVSRSKQKIYEIFKRVIDIFISLIGILVTIVLFPFIFLAIKIDSQGSVFYSQKRVGKNRKIFTIYKFRTMRENLNHEKEIWREKNEDEITRVGKFLRKFYLDELPQFWNVLKGDLSLVGPRPEWLKLTEIFEKEIPFYRQRYLVKPGLISWAWVNYPASQSVKEAKEKFKYDIYYIKNRSLMFDFLIFLKVLRIVF